MKSGCPALWLAPIHLSVQLFFTKSSQTLTESFEHAPWRSPPGLFT